MEGGRWAVVLLLVLLGSVIEGFARPSSLEDGEDDLAILKSRLLKEIIPSPSQAEKQVPDAEAWMKSLSPDGSWSDIDYKTMNRNVWPAFTHVIRLEAMTRCYVAPGTRLHLLALLKSKIKLALDWWLIANLTNTANWYQNWISNPISMGRTALQLDSVGALMPNQSKLCSEVMFRANWTRIPPGMSNVTGANLIWEATAHVYNGLLMGNASYVLEALHKMWAEIATTPHVMAGIKEDRSFFQHGDDWGLLYAGGYGQAFTFYLLQWIDYTRGTQWEVPKHWLSLFSAFVLEGQEWMIVGSSHPHWDVTVIGREVGRPNHSIYWTPDLLMRVPGRDSAAFAQLGERLNHTRHRPLSIGNRAYWKADYAVHRREDWVMTLRMYSLRNLNTECIANENKKGKHMGAGATFLYYSGKEYSNSYPLWDWQNVPGTTVERDGNVICLELTDNPETHGITEFVGTASDGTYGCSAFHFIAPFNYSTLSFKKGWFFFDKEIVMLAGDITSRRPLPVTTAIDQKWLHGEVHVSTDSETPLSEGTHSFDDVWWIHHNNTAYIFPFAKPATDLGSRQQGVKLTISNEKRTGEWSDIGVYSMREEGKIFSAYVTHPYPTTAESVAMITVPGISYSDWLKEEKEIVERILILSNTAKVQAVYHKHSRLLSALFYEEGSIRLPKEDGGTTIQVEQPCLIMMRRHEEDGKIFLQFTVTDPTQLLEALSFTVDLQLEKKQEECGVWDARRGTTTVKVPLPQGEEAGRSVVIRCQVK